MDVSVSQYIAVFYCFINTVIKFVRLAVLVEGGSLPAQETE